MVALLVCSNVFAQDNQKSDFEYLKGKWVKSGNERDTLFFTDTTSFVLKLEHGTIPPRDPEGLYFYSLNDRGIVLHWAFADSYHTDKQTDYYKLDKVDSTLYISNFYLAHNSGKHLVFKKIM